MKLILWDFDGTLATRDGNWSGAVAEILQDVDTVSINAVVDDIRPLLRTGFPWHEPTRSHTQIKDAKQWWASITPHFEEVFRNLGCSSSVALRCARLVRPTYLDRASWRLFADTAALGKLSEMGWTHWIVSNHVPELKDLIEDLGLGVHVTEVFTSGLTGYEKPNPEAYRVALDVAQGQELDSVWMVGDSFVADYQGPRSVGIPSILARRYSKEADLYAETLWRVVELMES